MKRILLYFLLCFSVFLQAQTDVEFGGRFIFTADSLIVGTDSLVVTGIYSHQRKTYAALDIAVGDFLVDCDCNVFEVKAITPPVSAVVTLLVERQDPLVTSIRACTGAIVRYNNPPNGTFSFPVGIPQEILDCVINYNFKSLTAGSMTLNGLTDVDTTGILDGQGLQWDSTNNVWLPLTLLGESTLADNGLTLSGDTVILGGTLNQNTTIAGGAYGLTVTRASGQRALIVQNTSNGGAISASSGSFGDDTMLRNPAITAAAYKPTVAALQVSSYYKGRAAYFFQIDSLENSVSDLAAFQKQLVTGKTAAAGIGVSNSFWVQNSLGGPTEASRLSTVLTDATSASVTSRFDIYTVNSLAFARKLSLAGSGQLTLDGYGTWASFQNDTTSRIAALTPTGEVVWRDASTLLGAADGNGIYDAEGTVAPVADMLVKLRTDTTFSIAETNTTGFQDYWTGTAPSDYFRGYFNADNYYGGSGFGLFRGDNTYMSFEHFSDKQIRISANDSLGGVSLRMNTLSYPPIGADTIFVGQAYFEGTGGWKYYFPKTSPSVTSADTSFMVWIGDGTRPVPSFIEMASISGGGTGTDDQNLSVGAGTATTSIIEIENGTDVTLEAGTNITLSELGNTITIAATGGGTDDQTLSVATNDSISIEDGNTIQLPINELQADSISNDTIWVDFENRYQKIHQYDMTSVTGTVTLILSNPITSGVYTLDFKNLSGSVSIVWPAAVKDVNRVALGTIVYNGPFIRTMYYDGTDYIAPPDELEEIAFVADTITGATKTIDLAYSRQGIYDINMAAINAVTLTISNPASPGAYSFHLTNVVGTDAVTWPANFVTMNDVALGTVNYTTGTMITCYYNPKRAKYFCK